MTDVFPRVKICGITRLEDAELAVQLGAWAVGMVFYEPSPRRCSLEQGQLITTALRRRAELCGVFVNAPMEEIVGVSEQLGLTMLQLHGEEGPSFCGEVARRTGARVVKALQVAGPGDIRDAARFHTDFHLLDARSTASGREGLRGGTGETFDWKLLEGRRSITPLILSGGLQPENVGEAIGRVHPFAVDTASGTESAPGRKDPAKLRDFFAAVERVRLAKPTGAAGLAPAEPEPAAPAAPEPEALAQSMASAEPEPAALARSEAPAEPTLPEPAAEGAPSVGSPA